MNHALSTIWALLAVMVQSRWRMPDRIEPALAADEWAMLDNGDNPPSPSSRPPLLCGTTEYLALMEPVDLVAAIAHANFRLPDSDPRKITRGWITGLRERAAQYVELSRVGISGDWLGDAVLNEMIADALESYLPSEPDVLTES